MEVWGVHFTSWLVSVCLSAATYSRAVAVMLAGQHSLWDFHLTFVVGLMFSCTDPGNFHSQFQFCSAGALIRKTGEIQTQAFLDIRALDTIKAIPFNCKPHVCAILQQIINKALFCWFFFSFFFPNVFVQLKLLTTLQYICQAWVWHCKAADRELKT